MVVLEDDHLQDPPSTIFVLPLENEDSDGVTFTSEVKVVIGNLTFTYVSFLTVIGQDISIYKFVVDDLD